MTRLKLLLARVDWFVILVLLMPFLVLTYYKNWIITYPGWIDPWYSLGYFFDLNGTLRMAPNYYPSNRLAYWIPGSIVYHIFPVLTANYVLRLAYYLASTLSVYSIVSRRLGRKTALLVCVILSSYWHFLIEVGWQYVDGAAMAYVLLSLACLTRSEPSKRRWLWVCLAGLFFAAAVNTNLILVSLFPSLALIYLNDRAQFHDNTKALKGEGVGKKMGAPEITSTAGYTPAGRSPHELYPPQTVLLRQATSTQKLRPLS